MKRSPFKLIDQHYGLGTYWWIEVFDDLDEKTQRDVSHHVQQRMREFEEDYSRFLPHSLLSRLNNAGALRNAPHEMIQLLELALQYYRSTQGMFHVATGHIQEAHGYDAQKRFSVQPSQSSLPPLTDVLEINGENVLLKENVKIDFGGFGKGWFIDSLADSLQNDFAIDHFLINGGGDLFGTSDHGEPLTIVLEDPLREGRSYGTVSILNQAIAGSSPFKRAWKDPPTDTVYTHLIHPADGSAAIGSNDLATFTIADSTADADAYATTFSLLGKEREDDIQQMAHDNAIEYACIATDGTLFTSPHFPFIHSS